jgi:hypothetical protein
MGLRLMSTGGACVVCVVMTSAARAQETGPPSAAPTRDAQPANGEPARQEPSAQQPSTEANHAEEQGEQKGTVTRPEEAYGRGESLVEKANDPATPAFAFSLQNYFVPALYGRGGTANELLVRSVVPIDLGVLQLVRMTLPVPTAPATAEGEQKAGIGDLNVYDLVVLTPRRAELQFGVGPNATFPTAVSPELGAGKWQLGAASVLIWRPSEAVMIGALVTWQASVGSTKGGRERPGQDELVVQPIAIVQAGSGFYLRSTAESKFDLLRGEYVVPLGVGAGKVVKAASGKASVNMFLEPQFSVLHDGPEQPAVQLLGGVTVQLFN